MSKLSYLEKLLNEAKFEWKNLSDVARIKNGKDHKSLGEGKFPVYGSGGIMRYADNYAYNKSSVLIPRKGSLGNLFFVDVPFWTVDTIFYTEIDEAQIRPKYLYYFLTTVGLGDMNQAGGVPSQTQSVLNKLKIPVPCPENPEKSLAIQAEIVRILDKFTALTSELTAELAMRKKQYNYYRDQLLSFEEGEVEWKTLDEVASFRRGSFPQPYGNSEWYNGEGCMPFVQVADVADFGFRLHRSTKQQISKLAQSKSVFVEAGTVIVSLQGTIGRVALTQYDCYVDRTLAIFTKYKAAVNKKYFAHQLKAKFDLEKEFARGSTLKTITKEEFSKFQIPIPPLEVQNRIVALLDKFDRLTHSIEEGLPRELELRQKQYEYYRELLFSFPRPETASN
ncbi:MULTISPECIES: restriction endonuclease subunit S [Enterobacteriaceae]|uniref:Restriction endonuclease subunit S n=1 Tax=Pseudocitrobacter vendiensis TaxID=2488306 RepID=A0ABM9FGG2_9ENTR|nr:MULTISPECIES: restriction endonuclease subunit S [Enterobacteriaceae]MBW9592594.1 restriction endonuclease subunit S [Citrobacter freundii]MCX3239911.1 restriction endonuclease subunit S [Escherichia coli]QLR20819.1 restriction endonuclease subunit S [Citrobacter freundii]CAH6662364.1 restriction endonuclease subunit S [Pseudocitrobacter vendiensis]HEE0043763.1 restriction endonuclease subunit S [Citrobacter freundii]